MVRTAEFQAVVLAGGKGSRMTELTAGKPKCLLPIANKPMIWYPLNLLEKAGFAEVIVVASESSRVEILSCLDKLNFKVKLEVVGVPNAEDLGTADSLRHISDKINTDIVVVSCDLITNADISELLNLYRKHGASVVSLLFPILSVPSTIVTPGPKNKQRPETDLIGIDNETDRLIFLASASDFEENIELSTKLISKHSDVTMHSRLLDAHLYVMNKWVFDYLVHDKKLSTLKGEVLPYIVRKQLAKPENQTMCEKNLSLVRENVKEDIFRFAKEKPYASLIREMSSFNDHSTDMKDPYHGDIIRCYGHVAKDKSVWGWRANTIQMYSLANEMITKWINSSSEANEEVNTVSVISPTAVVKCTQMQSCRVDDNAFVDEKTSLKECYIGANVKIESKTRISGCVVMENVTIKQRCVIDNCILCNGCVIEEGSQLKDCIVGARHNVPSNSLHAKEVLTDADRLMEFE